LLKSRNAVILDAPGFFFVRELQSGGCAPGDMRVRFRAPGQDQEMSMNYEANQPARSDIDALAVPLVIEFGTAWCGYCMAAQPLIESALNEYPALRHLKVEDGPGRPLGRSFRVKLWPTLIFMADGREVARVVRPGSVGEISSALRQIADA
jgi:thioredoxin 1